MNGKFVKNKPKHGLSLLFTPASELKGLPKDDLLKLDEDNFKYNIYIGKIVRD